MRILINALSGIGDAIMFTPALLKLHELSPGAQIDAIVMFKGVRDIYSRIPELNNVIFFDFLKEGAVNSLKFVFSLRGKYDASINVYPSNRAEYNVISLLEGTKKRVGVRYLRKDLSNLGFLNNISVRENDDLHNVEENIALIEQLTGKKVAAIPGLSFPLENGDLKFAENYLTEKKISDGEFVVGFHAGCNTLKNHINRRWSPENFAGLGKEFIALNNAKVLVFGGPDEVDLKSGIVKNINSDDVFSVDTGSMAQTAAVMKRCNLFVTNDSGLMHVAAAMKLKVLALIGPTNTNYIYPWQTEYKISSLNLECAPCFYYSPKPLTCTRTDVKYKCIRELEIAKVYRDAMELAGIMQGKKIH